jgi:hypothetical protein
LERPVRLYDHRNRQVAGVPVLDISNQVKLATRVGRWNGRFTIEDSLTQTTNGPLSLTEEDLKKAARFLIDMTARLDSGK